MASRNNPLAGLTPGGVGFIKCVTSAPDFDSSGSRGVPDMYAGRTLPRQHTLNSAIAFAGGSDTYIIVPPVPGTSYWTTAVAIGTSIAGATWTEVLYQDFSSLFNTNGAYTQNVSSFRYSALTAELESTTNDMNWVGNITVMRQPIRAPLIVDLTATALATPFATRTLTGFNALGAPTVSDVYIAPFNKGAYSVSMNRNAEFNFEPVLLQSTPSLSLANDTGGAVLSHFTGMSDLDSIIIKVSVPGSVTMSGIIRTWACVEYTPSITSALYQYSGLSADPDYRALMLYRQLMQNLPIAVAYADNATFWQRVLSLIRGITNVTNSLPGPAGVISNGVRAITEGIASI
jgi:hypothetical protein